MKSSQAQVAKLIRTYLKSIDVFARVKSTSFAGGSAVDIYLTDIHPEIHQQIKAHVAQYQYGHFDGSTDYYDMDNLNDSIPQVTYVTTYNEISEGMKQKIFNVLKPTLKSLEGHHTYSNEIFWLQIPEFGEYLNEVICKQFHKADFWNEYLK